jgi:hypothetical protein
MGIELNHRRPAWNTRACVTGPNVILNTRCSRDLAHARDQTFRSAYNKMAASDLLFRQCDICCVTLLRTETQLLVLTGVPAQRTHSWKHGRRIKYCPMTAYTEEIFMRLWSKGLRLENLTLVFCLILMMAPSAVSHLFFGCFKTHA